jgi:hypothetical protein
MAVKEANVSLMHLIYKMPGRQENYEISPGFCTGHGYLSFTLFL